MNQTETKATIGTTLRSRRQELKLSQQALVGERYSKTYLSKVECGQLEPSAEFLTFLAERLDLSVNNLLEEAHIKPKKASRKLQEMELMNAQVALQGNQPDKAKQFLSRLAEDQLPPDLLPMYYANRGEAEVGLRDYNSALADLDKALKLYQALPRVTALQVERVRNWIALTYYRMSNYYNALSQHRLCLQAIQDGLINDTRFKLKVYYNLANDYLATGEKEQAMNLYKEAVKLAEQGEDTVDLAGIYWGIGLAYFNTEDLDLAKLYLTKSAELYQKIGEKKLATTASDMLGQTLTARKEYTEAENILKGVVEASTSQNDNEGLSMGHNNLASLYSGQQQLDKAEQNARLAIESAEKLEDKMLLGQALAQLAEIKLAQSNLDEGLKMFDQSVAALETTDATERLAKVYFRYAAALETAQKLPEAIQKYRKAYDYQRSGKVNRS